MIKQKHEIEGLFILQQMLKVLSINFLTIMNTFDIVSRRINNKLFMQQVQKVNDYCTRRENCPKSRRRVGQHVKCNNTFCTCCIDTFFLRSNKKTRKEPINNSFQSYELCLKNAINTFCTIVDRLLTDACNKD
jgi:hypothetical protein